MRFFLADVRLPLQLPPAVFHTAGVLLFIELYA